MRTLTFRISQGLLSRLDAHVERVRRRYPVQVISRESVLRNIIFRATSRPVKAEVADEADQVQ